jgi:predicted GIY-YIG superfamily endonuclease
MAMTRAKEYCLYWIRTPEHTDPYSEGYIGVTTNFQRRVYEHKSRPPSVAFGKAVSELGWKSLVKEVLVAGKSKSEALELEKAYRPDINIGWNMDCGGMCGPNQALMEMAIKEYMNQPEMKAACSARMKKRYASDAERHAQSVRMQVASPKGQDNGRSKLTNDEVAFIRYSLIPAGMSNPDIAAEFSVSKDLISRIRVGNRWAHI